MRDLARLVGGGNNTEKEVLLLDGYLPFQRLAQHQPTSRQFIIVIPFYDIVRGDFCDPSERNSLETFAIPIACQIAGWVASR